MSFWYGVACLVVVLLLGAALHFAESIHDLCVDTNWGEFVGNSLRFLWLMGVSFYQVVRFWILPFLKDLWRSACAMVYWAISVCTWAWESKGFLRCVIAGLYYYKSDMLPSIYFDYHCTHKGQHYSFSMDGNFKYMAHALLISLFINVIFFMTETHTRLHRNAYQDTQTHDNERPRASPTRRVRTVDAQKALKLLNADH